MSWRPSPELRPTLWDGAIVLLVAVLAAGCASVIWGGGGGAAPEAVITADGAAVERIPLENRERTERIVSSCGYTLRVVAEEGDVWVESADCPTQDCVRTGHISRSGQSIVCLPARVIVRLEGGTADSAVDAVIG